jgi:allene oxide cyclase
MNVTIIAAVVLAIGSAPVVAGERLQVVERSLNDNVLDLGAKGDSAGDLLTFANPIYDGANKVQLGSAQGLCVRVVVGKSWECFWTLVLKDGQITNEGPFYDSGDSLFAVTGGTGKYAGAKGQMKLHARDPKASSYDMIYEFL